MEGNYSDMEKSEFTDTRKKGDDKGGVKTLEKRKL